MPLPEGELAVGIFACRDIEAGEQLRYDYGDRESKIPFLAGGDSPNKKSPAPVAAAARKCTEASVRSSLGLGDGTRITVAAPDPQAVRVRPTDGEYS